MTVAGEPVALEAPEPLDEPAVEGVGAFVTAGADGGTTSAGGAVVTEGAEGGTTFLGGEGEEVMVRVGAGRISFGGVVVITGVDGGTTSVGGTPVVDGVDGGSVSAGGVFDGPGVVTAVPDVVPSIGLIVITDPGGGVLIVTPGRDPVPTGPRSGMTWRVLGAFSGTVTVTPSFGTLIVGI